MNIMKTCTYFFLILLIFIISGYATASAQENVAQQAYLILEQSCLNCHGPQGAFTENIVIESAAGLVNSGAVVPGAPNASEVYTRLLETDPTKRMPLGGQLSPQAIQTIHNWIQAGAPNWEIQYDVNFITTDEMFTTIQNHLEGLDDFAKPSARYFTTTHLYNAGESPEALRGYQIALSKLVNSLSWGFVIEKPRPIDEQETIFYIDLRWYEWDTREAWTQIEEAYPYTIAFDPITQAGLLARLNNLRQVMDCQVPVIHADWFLATASLPPLYHDILDLPDTEQQLERDLGINVARNIQTAPGVRVWRAGTNDSGVSVNNRVVERHTSRYGAYWKSHDFASSVGAKNIFTHPLSFQRDGGEVIFNLPNGLQAYYISDALGVRIDVAPTDIVSNPGASDPAVRNGLSCIGCHTEGMKSFEDGVRSFIEATVDPAYDKDHALRLYVEETEMADWVDKDTQRYRDALALTGGAFGGIEPVHRFYEVFQGSLNVGQAAAAIGLEPEAFREQIRGNPSLQNLGLTGLLSDEGSVKRDEWTANFSDIVACLYSNDCPIFPEDDPIDEPDPIDDIVRIPDTNLRAVIAERLGKGPGDSITVADIARLTELVADERGIRELTGLEHAVKLERIEFRHNAISDLSPLAGLVRLNNIKLRGNRITDVSPLAALTRVDWLGLEENQITDLSPLKGLVKLNGIGIERNPISDAAPLAGMLSLEGIDARHTSISDFSPLSKLPRLRWIEFGGDKSISDLPSLKGLKALRRLEINECSISNISGLSGLTQLTSLTLNENSIKDVSPLENLKALTHLNLQGNLISDVSALTELKALKELYLNGNIISDVSPLAGLSRLETLNLRNNAISDFSPLKELADKIFIKTQENPGVLQQGGPKITGPWLWVLVPGIASHIFRDTDVLARASKGAVTEREVATNGATEGKSVGDNVWFSHQVSTDWSNIRTMLLGRGILENDSRANVVYGSLTLDSPREQQTKIFAGSDDLHKVWLNGQLANEGFGNGVSGDYQEFFPVTLKKGKNVLLVGVYDYGGGWGGHFGFAPDAEYTVLDPGTKFSLSTASTQIQEGDNFILHLNAASITDLAGWQTDIAFDPALLKANWVSEGRFLKQGEGQTFFNRGTIKNKQGKITNIRAARTSEGGANGDGTLFSVNFTALATGQGRVVLRNFRAGSSAGETILSTPPDTLIVVGTKELTIPAWDVNADGITNAIDVQLVTAALGQTPPENPRTDVNNDGVVDGKDLVLVAEHLGEKTEPAAPSVDEVSKVGGTSNPDTREMIARALNILHAADDGSAAFQRGIANLEQLLALFIPERTLLLHNYPNPFNPETWIPYQLAAAAHVTLHIYAANGVLVRTLNLGYQPSGIYQYRSRAAYWDGKNEVGEAVASGIYFYTLTAGDFTATRKMLIMK